ncbi:phosphatase 2C-domain-containing protein [Chaetomidium leptoderma]|uniref:Adenylate cyclase n=1 Tax=Chaetomidium leptoderma TaxID=669021 RepID=A0AAN6VSM6_9PEZI|nr:phosphatase 2C-domain-containing protein [Chaetomidium leptoderma]
MPRPDETARFSTTTGSSTDSARSSITVKPLPLTPTTPSLPNFAGAGTNVSRFAPHGSRRAAPSRLKTDESGNLVRSVKDSDGQISPTSNGARLALSPSSVNSNTSMREHAMSDLFDYRRDLAILDPAGGRSSRNQHNNPSTGSLSQIAPWMMAGNGAGPAPTPDPTPTTFYNDSTDNLSLSSQLSPGIRTSISRATPAGSTESPDAAYFTDERRPSVASITTTASSQGSRASGARGGIRKLQGFFGEEFPGRDSSETSLPHPGAGKEQRSHSYSYNRPHRDRNFSNATDHGRDGSPSSRPRTPVPAPEVVPFLYQEADDIARYGEAPVRDILSGPDRDRFASEGGSAQNPPKTSGSGRSGHSIVHLPGHHHRHNKSNEDPRSLRPSISKEDSALAAAKERSGSTTMYGTRSRAQSPAPSASGSYWSSKHVAGDGQTSPGHHHKRRFLGRLRGRREKDEPADLRKLPGSSQSLQPRPSKPEFSFGEVPTPQGSEWPDSPDARDARDVRDVRDVRDAYGLRPGYVRGTTFNNKFPFSSKKSRTVRQHDDIDENIGPTDRQVSSGGGGGTMFHLDTNLSDMEGILSRPLPLTPMDAGFINDIDIDKLPIQPTDPNGAWNAPDSWAVRREEEALAQVTETDDIGSPPRQEEKMTNYCIRVFRADGTLADGTFATLQMSLDATVSDLVSQIVKKSYLKDPVENYSIVMKKHDLIRVLSSVERPLLIQKRLLQQVGYEDRDRIEDIGREDNSYLCRFMFLSARTSDFHAVTHDVGFGRMQKYSHVDMSGRNLSAIPLVLYSRAAEIISLNLSRNLSLDVPRDFIQSCTSLRDIKFTNNEARKLPPSLGCASKLTYLDVSNNRVEQLEHADLGALTGLLKLNLANNRLNHLPAYFGAYSVLRTLNISSNFLEKFPAFICNLESLVDLDLSFNLIGDLPDTIGELRNLEKLVITNNRLAGTFPGSFRNLRNLRELDIKYNTITNIDVIAQLPKLEILTANHNSVSQFVGTFERLRSLKLDSNPVTKFEIRTPVPTLKLLNLSSAQLASIDESFNNMPSLERLILDRNYFVSLPSQIGNLRKLEQFSIAHNSVRQLPAETGCLAELRILDVHGNNIRKLPMELWWANKLETLNASSNILEHFPKPASRAPQPPEDPGSTSSSLNSKVSGTARGLSPMPSVEELNGDASRRPSQASSTLLSVGPSPVPGGIDRKGSMVSLYGKGGRKTSVVSRSTQSSAAPMGPGLRKDSGLTAILTNTFAGSLRNLYLADNQLDDDLFEHITPLSELRVLNLSYNELSDMPQRSIKNWPQLTELYLSGNDLTSLPADDLEESTLLQTLHINNNKFTNLPAEMSRAKRLAVLDCGSNSLKYNIANVPYDWNWYLNTNLRYLNLSGNRRLEIKQTQGMMAQNREQKYDNDFSCLSNLRVLGLIDVTLTQPSIPDQSEDRRVRTTSTVAGYMPYGMADTLGKNEHLSTIDLVVPRFNSADSETLIGLFDGQALSSGGSKIAKYLHENFDHIFAHELRELKTDQLETPEDALRRAFLALNKDLVTAAIQHTEDRPLTTHRGSQAPLVLSKEDLNSGGVATVVYLNEQELYVANVGDVQAMLIQTDGQAKMLTKKHDPADPPERSRIRDAGGWVSRQGRLNELLSVSRAFGYVDLMPSVHAAPHIKHHTIGDQDETILIATREVWEYLTPELVVDVARSVRGDLMRAAQKIRDLAMAYGSKEKIMVMMLNVSDLKRRRERSRMHRGQSMSWFNFPQDDPVATRRGRKAKADGPLDSTLQRLEAEVPAPTGMIAIVFTDIKNSTQLWETYPEAMRLAIKLHNKVMRRQLRRIGGFEVKTEGDAFMVSFPTATSALLWCFAVQSQLLTVNWPNEMLNSINCQPAFDRDNKLIFRGLSVRMGTHWGEPLAEPDPVTRRMDYYGPMVNKASRISACADGGQITVSSDFIMEIQRCLETYQESTAPTEDSFDEDIFARAIRNELRSLSSQGFEVKDMGEKKLKGLENPEYIYSLYPNALAGRIEQHTLHERGQSATDKPAMLSPDSQLAIDPEDVFGLWHVALRLEMLCSAFEDVNGRGLQAPETELMERMKHRGGEVTERFLINFIEHQVSRVETCISTLAVRHLVLAKDPINQLGDLRAPMAQVLETLTERLALLQKYEARFGPLDDNASAATITTSTGQGAALTAASVSAPAAPALPLLQQQEPYLNGLHVTIPQQPPASGSGSASAESGVNTPESSPF